MSDVRIRLNSYQESFLLSKKRYPAMIAGIGTGKTMMMLSKIWRVCERYPDTLALVARKEFTDLRDSTMKDFTTYFGVEANSEKDYKFPNGSCIMFRHAAEFSVLKNVNLSMFGIEQAEELETEDQFVFLRDRLRRKTCPIRQGIIIANANGHNWIWRLWINNPRKNYEAFQATTFDNAHNLPLDFIDDLREMEMDAPNHYKQYVMNNHEVVESDDLILSSDDIDISLNLVSSQLGAPGAAALALDVARFGKDLNVATLLESRGAYRFEQALTEDWGGLDLMVTTGKFLDLSHRTKPKILVVDGDGLGAGVVDRMRELKIPVIEFRGGKVARHEDKFFNRRSEGFIDTADLVKRGWLKLVNKEEVKNELLSIKFSFDSKGRKKVESVEEMKKRGLKSPNFAASLMMAIYYRRRISMGVRRSTSQLPRKARGHISPFFKQSRRAVGGVS